MAPLSDVHPEGHFVSVRGKRLWCEVEGTGAPLLLLAGGPGSSHSYLHPLSVLAKDHQLIHFDPYGCGKSDKADHPSEYSFEGMVHDVEGLRIALGMPAWSVLGHSYGGIVAQAYALAHPTKVTRLVLANTLHSPEMYQAGLDNLTREIQNQFPEIWERIAFARARGLLSVAPEHQKAHAPPIELVYFYDGSNAVKTVFDINTDVYYAICGDDGDLTVGGDNLALDFRGRLHTLSMPTMICAGRYDRLVLPKYTVEFRTHAPQASFVMFEKSGHLPFLEEPERFFEVLRAFLST